MKYKLGDILAFDGKEINIKMQIGLRKGEYVVFKRYHPKGLILKKSNGKEFGVNESMSKHFKKVNK